MIVGICGKKGHGKSTVAAMFEAQGGFRAVAYADPLKRAAMEIFGLTNAQVYGTQAQKETTDPRWGLSPRQILQRLGTEVGRSVHPDTWVRALFASYAHNPRTSWVISDVRFPNEAEAIYTRGGVIVRVVRPDLPPSDDDHASETAEIPYNYLIHNTPDDLEVARGRVAVILADLREKGYLP